MKLFASAYQVAAGALLFCAVSASSSVGEEHSDDRVSGIPYKAGEQPLHESYAGHITVRTWTPDNGASKDSGSAKLFYWYFPAIAPKVEEPPLVLWIQGGPGSSSMIGLFTEMGPLELTDDGEFTRRNVTWANEYDFLVVDQPAGTGFSSVSPQANLTLDDLYPLAKQMPKEKLDEWRAKYPGNPNQYRSIESPSSTEYIVAEAEKMRNYLLDPSVKWPAKLGPFLDKFSNAVYLRNEDALGMSRMRRKHGAFHVDFDYGRSRTLDSVSDFDRVDPYFVNRGYGHSDSSQSVWERLGLDKDESQDFVNGYAANMRAVAKDMWSFMQKFYNLRPVLRKRDFYIFSESYGGKFVPAIATYIDEQNTRIGKNDPQTINMRGVSIGNSLVHPPLQILAHGSIGFSWGLLDAAQADIVDLLAFKAVNHTLNGDLEIGGQVRLLMFDYFRNVTGGINWYDIRKRNHKYKRSYLDRGLNTPVVRKALHSEEYEYGVDWGVYYHLSADIMRTSAPMFPRLLEKYPVNLNQGQFDFRDGVASNTLWINELSWSGRREFAMADRQQWWLGKELAGYKRIGGNLTHWTILNAGHMSPGDQPAFCLDMARHIVSV